MYELKNYRGVMCHGNGEWYKIWRGIDLSFQISYIEFEVLKIFNWHFWPKYIIFELKEVQELYLMTLKIDSKFEGKLTCTHENDMRDLVNLHRLK